MDYSVSENVLLFVGVSEGFKSGGFNGLGATAVEATTLFDPEKAWNYEIGAKTSIADDRVQLNVSAFRLDFTDLQLRDRKLTIPGDESSAIVNIINAAKARIKGVEAEFIVAPVEGLRLSGFLATLDAEIVGVVPGSTTIIGTVLPRSPKTTIGLSGNYQFPVGNAGDLSLRADYRHVTKQFYDINEPPASLEPGYGLLDLRLGFDSANGPWGLSGWCKNVTDKEYRSHVQQISAGRAGVTQVGDPRQCGVTVNVRM
ncbi:MAG: TonB-dependent receptor [Alphaproteobacteria bacterium]|nr:TonB-dependent receptor [Alphaproteobacteria bacterium]